MGVDSIRLAGLDTVRSRRRRWPFAAGAFAVVMLVAAGVLGGAALATRDAVQTAQRLAAGGDFGGAIALDDAIATRNGALFVLARSDVGAARHAAQLTLLGWAASLAREGKVDTALALLDAVTEPHLRSNVDAERSSLLLEAARGAAAAGHYSTALVRLDQLGALPVLPSGTSALIGRLTPEYAVGAARVLLAQGHAADAVAMLDTAGRQYRSAARAAAVVLPAALLAAGRQEIADESYVEASATLQRIVSDFSKSPQSATARSLLAAGERVAGTLSDRTGHPIRGQVRLSSHYFPEGSGYYTTGPFFYATTDANGDFAFSSVPVGGPYILEVLRGGTWTTFVDPGTGQPANTVKVAPLTPVNLTFVALP